MKLIPVVLVVTIWLIHLMAHQILMGYLMLRFESDNLYIDIWFQVILSNNNNLHPIIWLE